MAHAPGPRELSFSGIWSYGVRRKAKRVTTLPNGNRGRNLDWRVELEEEPRRCHSGGYYEWVLWDPGNELEPRCIVGWQRSKVAK